MSFNSDKEIDSINQTVRHLNDEMIRCLKACNLCSESILYCKDAVIEDCNESFTKLFKYSRKEIFGKDLSVLFTEEFKIIINEKIKEKNYDVISCTGLDKNGEEIPLNVQFASGDAESGKILLLIQDRTKLSDLEKNLHELEEKYNTFLNNSLVGIYIIQDTKFKEVNNFMVKESGFSKEEFLQWGLAEFAARIHPDDKEFVFQEMIKKMQGDESANNQYSFRTFTKEGELRWVSIYSNTITFENRNAILAILVDISEQKKVEEALRDEKEFISAVLKTSHDGIAVADSNGDVIDVNPAMISIFGFKGKEINNIFKLMDLTLDDKTKAEVIGYWNEDTNTENPPEREFKFKHEDGAEKWCRIKVSTLQNELFIINGIDITEMKKAELQIREKERRFRALADSTFEGILITDNNEILNANKSFLEMFGYSYNEFHELKERSPLEFIVKKYKRTVVENYLNKFDRPFEILGRKKNSVEFPIEVQIRSISREGEEERIIAVRDISHKHEIEYYKRHDTLTGMLNMNGIAKDISEYMRFGQPFDLMIINVWNEDLSNINQLGKNQNRNIELKELALIGISIMIRELFFDTDLVARNENEFIILVGGLDHPKYSTRKVVEKALSLFPYKMDEQNYYIRSTIGITNFPQDYDGNSPKVVINNAQTGIKWALKNNVSFMVYNEQQDKTLRNLIGLEQDLRHAVENIKEKNINGEFELYYQSKIDRNDTLIGSEALLRWNHPERGILLPKTFISISEQTGLIEPLGKYILILACKQLVKWNRKYPHLQLSVNISSLQLTYEFTNWIRDLLKISETRINPKNLELEITETESLTCENIEVLKLLHDDMNIRIAIDDFGVEKSSLVRLKNLPVDTIKIDKSFIETMLDSENDSNLVVAIINMGHSLGMQVVAEGVETIEQYKFLKNNSCDLMQGFYMGRKPFPIEEFEKLFMKSGNSNK